MPVLKKFYRGRLLRGRVRLYGKIKDLRKTAERKEGRLSPFDLIKHSDAISFLELKGERIDPESITPAKVKSALDKATEMFLEREDSFLHSRYLLDFSRKKKGESDRHWMERRRKAWSDFTKENEANRKLYRRIRNFMENSPRELAVFHEKRVRRVLAGEKETLSKLRELGFSFDPEKGNYQLRLTFLNSDTVLRYGRTEATALWKDSVKRAIEADDILVKALRGQERDIDSLEFMFETLLFESPELPNSRELNRLREMLEKKTPPLGFLADVLKTFRTEIFPMLNAARQ